MKDRFFDVENCDRCGGTLFARVTSMFNDDVLCSACKSDERKAPGYPTAAQQEEVAVRAGNYNFHGVGLSAEDAAFLKTLREAR